MPVSGTAHGRANNLLCYPEYLYESSPLWVQFRKRKGERCSCIRACTMPILWQQLLHEVFHVSQSLNASLPIP